ncbi:MAG: N-acetylglucosamine-6-phosphate deacetylase [Clostridiales bacterium]|nr:N-acetylglucosamine-6-phosphate deacetylase [Clostridiales bacterium]
MLLKNVCFYNELFEKEVADIQIDGGKISAVGVIAGPGRDMGEFTALPGFVDIHIHGCAGADASDGTAESLEKMSKHLAKCGVTSFCPTTMTLPLERLEQIAENIASFKSAWAKIAGINFEGPFIAKSKKGAQNEAYIAPADCESARRLYDAGAGLMKLITIAPEAFDSGEFIKTVSKYCTVAIGHSAASGSECKAAIDAGVTHATHLFNAMTPMTHREPGIAGTALDCESVTCELICDLHHVCPAVLRNAFKILGEDRACVISDSMRAAGLGTGEFELGGQRVFVKEGDCVARLENGTIAASVTNMFEEFKNLLQIGISFKTALKACTINPARVIGEDKNIGSIAPGKAADIVFVDKELNIREVYIDGKRA